MLSGKVFVLLSVFSVMSIYAMELYKPQACDMLTLPQDIARNRIQPLISFLDISRLKRTSQKCEKLYDTELACPRFHEDQCSTFCSQLAKNYYTCTKALGHFAGKRNEEMFQHLWDYHAVERDKEVAKIVKRSLLSLKDRMKVYKKYYNKEAKYIRKKVVKYAVNAIYAEDVVCANTVLSGGSLSIFDLLGKYVGVEKILYDNGDLDFLFYRACQLGSADLIKVLCGGIVDERSFEYILKYAGAELMLRLIHEGIVPFHATNDRGKSVLHYAAERGFEYVVDALLDKGVYVNCRDAKEMVPLHYAAKRGHLEAVLMLLSSKDVDVHCTNKKLKTVLDYTVLVKKMLPDDGDEIANRESIREILKARIEKSKARPYSYSKVHSNGYQKMHV